MSRRTRTNRRPHETVIRASDTEPVTGEDSDAFLDVIRGRFPEDDRKSIDRLDIVKAEYVTGGKDVRVSKALNSFLQDVLSRKNGVRQEGGALIVSGESGVGKSSAIARAIARSPLLQPVPASFGEISPVVSINLQGPATLKLVAKRILDEAGYPFQRNVEQGELWDMLPGQLHVRRILVVHIDEIQHIVRETKKDAARKDLADAIKDVMNYKPWPISFILSGMPQSARIAVDRQIERRCRLLDLPQIRVPEETRVIGKIIRQLCKAAGLSPEAVDHDAMHRRIAHAANYGFGWACQVVVGAIQIAFDKKADELDREHFAEAYRLNSHAYEIDEKNPFVANDYLGLPAGLYFHGKGNIR